MVKLDKNIVLIGMPGCGKTTIGMRIAKKFGMEFCDTDEYIVRTTNKSISQLFENGEEYFRKIEKTVIKKVSKDYPKVIATGGGVITKYENIIELKKNGIIIFINRPIKDIAEDITLNTRPLLKDGIKRLEELYKERYLLYKRYSEYEIINNNLNKSIEEIEKYIKYN